MRRTGLAPGGASGPCWALWAARPVRAGGVDHQHASGDAERVTSTDLLVRHAVAADHERWTALFDHYRHAGHLAPDRQVSDRVWAWTQDPVHPVSALIAADGDEVVGFAHYRRFPRPINGDEGLYLDDLFTRPAARGRGVAKAMIDHLADEVHQGRFAVLRWTSRPDNHAARGLYDRIAQRAESITYNLARQSAHDRPAAPGTS